ncbi:MAG TPA: GGDEF domain-containing protein [Bradyrhizobium sp.]|uniref:GGDEF domain-containing protein n=1 Tax=Bradyrhizobium sp. TaxID=376 RepID=UPI002D1BA1B1|nr:GGDEF domain-containing protein [Bradyrhizobium sp.]HLZ06659.1 GGDEF domain-containing protein [Bradyrhizobium sp.]
MLNVPTLWTVFVVNFLAVGLIWAYVAYTYPKLEAARFWAGSSVLGALGALLAMLVLAFPATRWPLFAGAALLVFAASLAAMGIERFYEKPASWRRTFLITGTTCAGLVFFIVAYDSMAMRVLIYSAGQTLTLAPTLKLLFSKQDGRANPGARLAGTVASLIIALFAIRAIGNLVGIDFSFTHSSTAQGALTLALIFLSMSFNFGFLLMAIDHLRNEVADLALLDDLTGVGNRRQLVQRLTEECARSERSGEPFALLVIDLDAFKTINDTYGHATGDACLQHFTLMAQTRLRPGDLLARTGGDEFCIVLPSSTLREGIMIARRVLDVCRQDAEACVGNDIPIAVSIGVAQWTREVGAFPDRLMAAADHALYAAKKEGKNCCAAYDPVPPLAPATEPAAAPTPALRKRA